MDVGRELTLGGMGGGQTFLFLATISGLSTSGVSSKFVRTCSFLHSTSSERLTTFDDVTSPPVVDVSDKLAGSSSWSSSSSSRTSSSSSSSASKSIFFGQKSTDKKSTF